METSTTVTATPKDGTVGKALDVLDQVASFGRPVRFGELLQTSRFPKATLYRFVQTLTNQNMLTYDAQTQTYSPGLRLVRLAHAAWKQASLAPIARPFLDQLADITEQTIHLAQMENGQVLYVDKRNAAAPVGMFSQAGKIGPGYCTGVGKVLLAFMSPERQEQAIAQQAFYPYTRSTLTNAQQLRQELTDIRLAGYGFDREEHEPGIICIAAPISTEPDRVIGALSITGTTSRISLDELEEMRDQLIETSNRIGSAAANWLFPE